MAYTLRNYKNNNCIYLYIVKSAK